MTELSAAQKAAEAILASRAPPIRTLRSRKPRKRLTIREAADRFNASKSAVADALKSLTSGKPRLMGRPRLLTDDEDEAIVAFVLWLQRTGLPASKFEVVDAANTLRSRRDPNAQPVSRSWYSRFLKDHPQLQKARLRPVEASRRGFEESEMQETQEFFEQLAKTIKEFRIGPSETWNEDECGIIIGLLRHRLEVLIIKTRGSNKVSTLCPGNREMMTLLGTGSAIGDTIPPWLIFKTLPTLDFADIDAHEEMRFSQSETGFCNSEIFFEWVHHFNRWSWEKSATAQAKEASFHDWFGCDEHLRHPLLPHITYDIPPGTEEMEEKDRIFRLLVIDGFTGHGAFIFREYCKKFDIIVVTLLPHSTHMTQPMDVGVFQPLKATHQKVLRQALRGGAITFSRLEFMEGFQRIFDGGFKPKNIISGFEKSGIFPPDPTPVVKVMLQKRRKKQQPIDPGLENLLPKETRFQGASDAARDIRNRYHDVLSSPTRSRLQNLGAIAAEASVMESSLLVHVSSYQERLSKQYNRRRKLKVPVTKDGAFSSSLSLKDMRQYREKLHANERKKQERQELRAHRKFAKAEIEKLRTEWRANKEVIINGIKKKLYFKPWLEHTGRSNDFISLETQASEFTRLLNEKTDGFMIDSPHPPEVLESIRKSRYAPKPLNAVDWSATPPEPGSDDPEEFRLDRSSSVDYDSLVQQPETPPWITSSPPPTATEETQLTEALTQASIQLPSTPCPPETQPHTPRWKQMAEIIRKGKTAQAARLRDARDDNNR